MNFCVNGISCFGTFVADVGMGLCRLVEGGLIRGDRVFIFLFRRRFLSNVFFLVLLMVCEEKRALVRTLPHRLMFFLLCPKVKTLKLPFELFYPFYCLVSGIQTCWGGSRSVWAFQSIFSCHFWFKIPHNF